MEVDYHVPVLLSEAVEGLSIKPNGVYVDLTFGGGGHSKAILNLLGDGGRLVGFDQDEDAGSNILDDKRFIFVNHNFRYLRNFMRYYGFSHVDGVLADLGVSSHEFDMADRGFSFRFDAKLDMRMNRSSKVTAVDVLNTYEESDLVAVFKDYGEIDNARRLASLIVSSRADGNIDTSDVFNKIIAPCVPKFKEKKYLAQVYQALRIEVNGELDALGSALKQALDLLNPGGRMVVITYHSLEDRIVKNFFKSGNIDGVVEKDPISGRVDLPFACVNRKVIVPSDEEIERNPRSRSAKLRILEKNVERVDK